MALSTVTPCRRFAPKSVSTVIGAALVCVYGALSLTSYFPAFHNHSLLARTPCCGNDEANCDISHSRAHHAPDTALRSGGNDEHAHGPCMACLWQAMKRRLSVSYCAHLILIPPYSQTYKISSAIPRCGAFRRLPQPRAPPHV